MVEKVVIGDATLYHGDCMDVLPTLGKVDAVVTDPPYGINWNVDASRFSGGASKRSRRSAWDNGISGDKKQFDPGPWILFEEVIMWGANNYQVPAGTNLVWVKRNPKAFGSFLSDAEVAWKKGGHGVYCHFDVSMNGAGANFIKQHPAEKPVGLMEWCLGYTSGQIVLDPFMGSGTTGVACMNLGRKFIGIELERDYFDIACERIDMAQAQGRLFK